MGTHGWQPAGPSTVFLMALSYTVALKMEKIPCWWQDLSDQTSKTIQSWTHHEWKSSGDAWKWDFWHMEISLQKANTCRACVPLSGWWAEAGKNWATKGPLQRWVYPIGLYFYYLLRNKFLVLEFDFLNVWKRISIITGIYKHGSVFWNHQRFLYLRQSKQVSRVLAEGATTYVSLVVMFVFPACSSTSRGGDEAVLGLSLVTSHIDFSAVLPARCCACALASFPTSSPTSRTKNVFFPPLKLLLGHRKFCSVASAPPAFSHANAVYLHWFFCSPLPSSLSS